MSNGYIYLHRSLIDWEWFHDHNTTRVFIYLLLRANHAPGRWKGNEIPRGSVAIGREKLAHAVGLEIQPARTAIKHLESTREITIRKGIGCSIIAINNWHRYQATNQTSNSKLTSNQPEDQQFINHKQEGRERDKEEKEKKKAVSCPAPESVAEPENAFLIFPVTGGSKTWTLTTDKLSEYKATFDTLDVEQQCKLALQWIKDNPAKRKTSKGMTSFINRWLTRAADTPARPAVTQPASSQYDRPPLISKIK